MNASGGRSLLFNLGAFVGHVVRAVKTDPRHDVMELRRETTQERRDTPGGVVTLRRTTIEEMRVEPPVEPMEDRRAGG